MKTNAIIRIVIYSLVIVILSGILTAGLGIGTLRFNLGLQSGEYITGEGSVNAEEIQNIEIEWVSGDIHVKPSTDETNEIRFSEAGYGGDENRMVWEQKGSTLVIKFSKPTFSFGFVSVPDKELTVTFPSQWLCGKLDVETVSGSMDVQALRAEEIEIESVSATCFFTGCSAEDVKITTVSGNVKYHGDVNEFDCDTVSADCEVLLMEHSAEKIKLNAVSGDLIVGIHASVGFTATIDSLSGNVYSDFHTTSQGGKQVYGDGSCRISASTVSGDIEIKKYEYRLT